uniref:Uncharacterized protein n=1 Tax=Rhizophora mucronata TaxID=61149 RepID=A0A2P2QFY3_RHIMU
MFFLELYSSSFQSLVGISEGVKISSLQTYL